MRAARVMTALAALSALSALSGCASGASGSYVRGAPAASAPASSQPGVAFRSPQVMRASGLDGVIGARAEALAHRFGDPRIDLMEGDARKLQFASDRCVLDIFLYPLEAGSEPVATHVAARRRDGSGEADSAGCIAQIERGAP
ncbi:hypothetical protein [Qipengyuania nanhaisediminis]|uniref:hypothetical protein n=1 Tax=Qipengyuania nanhaisediminis TaxID=604088 RepID=UPI0038B2C5FD